MEMHIPGVSEPVPLAELVEIVRSDQRAPSLTIQTWSIVPLSHQSIAGATGGIFMVHGIAVAGEGQRAWSVVLKLLRQPAEGDPVPVHDWSYWKREALAYQSGLLQHLPGQLTVPRCYGVYEYAGGVRLWIEHIVEPAPKMWTLDHYHLAAQHLGMFNGAFVTTARLPDYTWLTKGFFRSIFASGAWWTSFLDPNTSINAWQQELVRDWYPEPLQRRTIAVWEAREQLIDLIEHLPQTFCHLDAHRRNLMRRVNPDGTCVTVAIDWALAGYGQLGADAAMLVGTTVFYFEYDPSHIVQLEAAVMDGYMHGLRRQGWDGDPVQVRLGYVLQVALWWATTMPGWVALLLNAPVGETTSGQFGRSIEEIAHGWRALWEYGQECFDEARSLGRRFSV
jgi:hypothetical protein